MRTRRCGVLTVEMDTACVERRLGSGALACPECSGALAGWGHARARDVRDRGGLLRLVPRRARCTGCGSTHVLLPVLVLVRRADVVAVIGRALVAKAAGVGHRRIAAELGRSAETVRGWLRRFAGRVEACGWYSPAGAGRWPRTRCCLLRPGRRGQTRSPRSLRRRARWMRGLAPARCRSGRGVCGVEWAAARPGLATRNDQHELPLV
ncbi:MAG: DUF6431 domain-containing protein [Actinomycetota bacterium]|nr:DUF6431 domain-containing protein [Actinomycetota bacterium]